MKDKINILGVHIDCLSKKNLYKAIGKSLNSKEKSKIFTPNTEIIVKAHKNEKLKDILNSATISIPDGIGVIWAAKALSSPLPERLAGIDTAEFILSHAAKNEFSVFLLGGKDGVAKIAKKKLEEKYKGLNICGFHHGFFDAQGKENDEIIKKINNSGADIIFVCMGFPRQEMWISENIDKLSSVKLAVGLGGSLDVWAGNVKRAPEAFRKMSLEWLWRMMLEPKRIKFLPIIPVFAIKILRKKLSK